jgi:putative heme iron utilization protein
MNHDKMTNAPIKDVAQATMRMVDALQHHPAAIQSVAAAALFLTVCKVHRLVPQDVFTVANNMMADTIHGERPEFRALRLYAKNELT